MIRTLVSFCFAGVALSACATAPIPAPSLTLPSAWLAGPSGSPTAEDAYWTTVSTDTVLNDLLQDAGAIADVEIAAARAREARALLAASRASLFPTLGIVANTSLTGSDDRVGVASSDIGLSLTAPFDVFGANSSRAGAAAARAVSADAELDLARLIARRSAGQFYAALRAAQSSRAAAERQTRDANQSLSLAQARAKAGLENGLAVAQAQSAADAARARIPVYQQAETQARLGLEALMGALPGAFAERLKPAASTSPAAERLFDTPAAVIARRPDVRAAESRLMGVGLDARAARAERWPTLSLTAALSQTDASRGLAGGVATAGLGLFATLFDFGRLDALAQAAGARAEGEAVSFQRTVTYALSGVEREADRLTQARREAQATRAALASAQVQSTLARARYTSGLTSFLDVLVADRALADAAIAVAAAEGRMTDAAVSLAAEMGLGQKP